MREKHRNAKNLSLQINSLEEASVERLQRPTTERKLSLNIPTALNLAPQLSCTSEKQGLASPMLYPAGPIEICDRLYLYSEPTKFEANRFDVVINVAKEVANPFNKEDTPSASCSSEISPCSPLSSTNSMMSSSPSSSVDDRSFWAEQLNRKVESQDVPPQNVCQTQHPSSTPTSFCKRLATEQLEPEYVFIPWDHNSHLLQDLPMLTDLIEERTSQGKKVLVHCQCGISRSASLVLAYVMIQRHWDLNTAYSYVKERSPSISPNLTLMFQLMEWYSMFSKSPATITPTNTPSNDSCRTVVSI